MAVRQGTFCHQRVRDRHAEPFGDVEHRRAHVGASNATTNEEQWSLRGGHARHDLLGDATLQRGTEEFRRERIAFGLCGVERTRPHVHRDAQEDGPRTAALCRPKCALGVSRKILRTIDAPGAFAERPIELPLIPVDLQVQLLVRPSTAVVRRHIPGNDNERDGIERGCRRAGDRIHHPRPGMREHDTGLAGHTCVAVRHVRRSLLVARGDEVDPAPRQSVEDRYVRVAAQPEHDLDAVALQLLDENFGSGRRRLSRRWTLITRQR